VSWFRRAHLIANPSLSVLGRPGTGRSTVIQRMVFYMVACGITPLILGDLKPDYADTVAYLGGQVIAIGRGIGGLNVLDPARWAPPPPGSAARPGSTCAPRLTPWRSRWSPR